MGVVADRLERMRTELEAVRLQLREAQDQLAQTEGRVGALGETLELVAIDVNRTAENS
jgi:archaellum component FlaC